MPKAALTQHKSSVLFICEAGEDCLTCRDRVAYYKSIGITL